MLATHPISLLATGLSGLVGTILLTGESESSLFGINITSLRELGSFGLIAVFVLVILLGIRQLAPAFLKFLTDTKNEFLGELKAERAAREKSTDDFRQMLSSHKHDIREKLDEVKKEIGEGNNLTRELVDRLKKSPCLLKSPHP